MGLLEQSQNYSEEKHGHAYEAVKSIFFFFKFQAQVRSILTQPGYSNTYLWTQLPTQISCIPVISQEFTVKLTSAQ